MPASESSARRWLSPGPASPWRFDEAGEALDWRDGGTVAFRVEIEDALRRVARGLQIVPPFPAVAVLASAMRAEGRSISSSHWDLVRDAMESAAPWLFAKVAAVKEVAETASVLRMLEQVPDEVFARPDALASLAEAVFEAAEVPRDAIASAAFLRELDGEPTPGTAAPDASRAAVEWGEGLAALRRGLGRLDPATLLRRARTGLDHDVAPAAFEWPDGDRVRGLVASLRDDPQFGAIARLASDVMAAVRLPRPGALPEDLPIGGFGGLANRGSPERLLISELAHDGLTLAVRIALGEALYLRREPPPRAPRGTRCVLVDSGIRLWGVGRVFATSVALALGGGAARGVAVRTWRADGIRLEPVDLGRREGIDAHLAALRTEPHPAAAVRPFIAQCAAIDGNIECCIVMHERALDEPEVRDALRAAGRVVHVVTVAATGDLAVHAFGETGSQVLRTAKLDLDDLLTMPARRDGARPPLALRDPSRDDASLPAILRLGRLPLRMPHRLERSQFREAPGHGVVARTHDRRLVLWTERGLGPIELSDRTSAGSLREFCVRDDVVHLVTAGDRHYGAFWLRVGIAEPGEQLVKLPPMKRMPSDAIVFGDGAEYVGLVSDRLMHVVSADDPGRVASEVALPPGAHRLRGRIFARWGARQFWMLSGGGFDEIRLPPGEAMNVVTLFERHGRDGPWALLRGPHRLLDTSTGTISTVPTMDAPDFELVAVGSAGDRLLFASKSKNAKTVVDLRSEPWRAFPVTGKESELAEPIVANLLVLNVHGRADTIGVSSGGGIVLARRELRVSDTGSLVFGQSTSFGATVTFGRRLRLAQCRWEYHEAEWPDGSRAHVDSRGMLHLTSSDPAVPSMTIVHRDGPVAGWSSDGATTGDRYFLGGEPSVSSADFLARIRRFTERLR